MCIPTTASRGAISTRLHCVSRNNIIELFKNIKKNCLNKILKKLYKFLIQCFFTINFRIIGVCVAMSIMIVNETSLSRRIMETLRLIVTSLVYMGFIDGKHWISWIILLTTPLCIWCYPAETQRRTLGVMLGFFCPLTLLSASYEPLFFLTLTVNLLCWLRVAPITSKNSEDTQKITKDLFKAAFFVSFS